MRARRSRQSYNKPTLKTIFQEEYTMSMRLINSGNVRFTMSDAWRYADILTEGSHNKAARIKPLKGGRGYIIRIVKSTKITVTGGMI
jgi:hypothetical protein